MIILDLKLVGGLETAPYVAHMKPVFILKSKHWC